MNFPKHKCSLVLEHNPHRSYYISATEWIEQDWDSTTWENDEAKTRAAVTDEVWVLQWYPRTPVGFCLVAAPTLEELLAFAEKVAAEESE